MDANAKQRQQIADCAVDLFRKSSYDKVSVNEICAAAGVTRSAFYSLFQGKKSILDFILSQPKENLESAFLDFVDLENDFERIWCLCDRFVTIAMSFGPRLTGDLFIMQLNAPVGITEAVHSLDSWFIKLAGNCVRAGIIETEEPVEVIAPMATSLICQATYEWCNRGGSFNLREMARTYAEIAYHVVPRYRMTPEQRAAL